MNKAFLFIKVKNKKGIRKVKISHVKRVSGGFVVKKSCRMPLFVVPELKIRKKENILENSCKGDIKWKVKSF